MTGVTDRPHHNNDEQPQFEDSSQHTQPTPEPGAQEPTAQATQPQAETGDSPTVTFTESQAKRLKAPVVGMILSTLTVTALVGAFYFFNPEPDNYQVIYDEDVEAAAAWTAEVAEFAPVAPEVPETWTANYARWETRQETGVEVWEAGFTTEAEEFVGFAQTDQPNQAWINAEVRHIPAAETVEVDGFTLQHYQDDDRQYFVLEAEDNPVDSTTIVVGGDANDDDITSTLSAVLDGLGVEPELTEEELPDPAEVADPNAP